MYQVYYEECFISRKYNISQQNVTVIKTEYIQHKKWTLNPNPIISKPSLHNQKG